MVTGLVRNMNDPMNGYILQTAKLQRLQRERGRTPEFCILSKKSNVTQGEVTTFPQLPGSPSSSSTCPRPGAPAKLLPWTRISSTPTASLPAALTVRHVIWWKTATAAWYTCQVRPQVFKHNPGGLPLTCSPSISISPAQFQPTAFFTLWLLSFQSQFQPFPKIMGRRV